MIKAVKISFSAALSQKLHIETPRTEHQMRAATKNLNSQSKFFFGQISLQFSAAH